MQIINDLIDKIDNKNKAFSRSCTKGELLIVQHIYSQGDVEVNVIK